ncbi:MAG TPA: TetR/AcrR family transcriptional regulator [Ktedonobacterales bacterium]
MAHRAGLDEAIILRAAGEIADANGFDQLTLAHLAERLHVRSPSLYKHVTGLDDVRRGLTLLSLHTLAECLARAAIGKSGAESVRAVAAAYRAFARAHPGLYTAIQRAPSRDDGPRLIAAGEEIIETMRAVLAPWRLDDTQSIHAIRMLRALTHGFVSLECAGGFGIPIDLAQSYDYAVTTFIEGLNREANR